MNIKSINTFGELKSSGYKTRSIKDEMRENLIAFLKKNETPAEKSIKPAKTENLWLLKLTKRQNTPQMIHFSPTVNPLLFSILLDVILTMYS